MRPNNGPHYEQTQSLFCILDLLERLHSTIHLHCGRNHGYAYLQLSKINSLPLAKIHNSYYLNFENLQYKESWAVLMCVKNPTLYDGSKLTANSGRGLSLPLDL